MGLPLQPELTPWTAAQRRWLAILLVACASVALGGVAQARQQPARLLGSHGRPGGDDYLTVAMRLIEGARTRVTVLQFVVRTDDGGPVDHLLQALATAARRGVAVSMVLDRGNDWRTGAADDKHRVAAERLRASGVRVVLDEQDRTTHAKVLIVDERQVVVGSHNWTRSALVANREWSLSIEDPLIARAIQAEVAALPAWDGR